MPVPAPFTLKSSADSKSGTVYRDLYTVPAGSQAFLKSVIASNTASSSITPTLQLVKSGGDTVQLASPSLAVGAATNLLAGTVVMSAGDKIRQRSSIDYINLGSPIANSQTFPLTNSPQSLDFVRGNGIMVAVGAASSGADPYNNFVITSTDGVTWTWRDPAPSDANAYTLNSIAYGNGVFVAVGNGGVIVTSPDGVTWTKRTAAISGNLNQVVWGKDKFVCVCEGTAAASIQTSPDGITWTARTSATVTTTSQYQTVCYDPIRDMYAATTGNSTSSLAGIQTSPDGITWTTRSPASGSGNTCGVVALNGRFIVRTTTTNVIVSTDGVNWVRYDVGGFGSTNYVNNFKVCNGKVFFVRSGSVMTSSDGINWESITGSNFFENAFVYDGTNYYVLSMGSFVLYKVQDILKTGSTACSFTSSAVEIAA